MDPLLANIQILVTVFDRLALAIILALALASVWLRPTLSLSDDARRTRIFSTALLILIIAAGIELLIRTAVMADVNLQQAWPYIFRVIDNSNYGNFWTWRLYIWCLMLLTALWVFLTTWSRRMALLLFIAAIATTQLQSVTGHAGEDGLWSAANLINSLHLISISIWGGSVILYAIHVLPVLRRQQKAQLTAQSAHNLSIVAGLALGVVIITGSYNTWHQLKQLTDLWTTDYGQLLIIKLSLVCITMIIGAINKFYWVPKIISHASAAKQSDNNLERQFQRILLGDSLVFIIIIIVATILGTTPPPSHV